MRVAKLVSAIAMLLLVACTRGSSKTPALTMKGSDTMLLLGQAWAEAFMRTHPGTSIQVTGGGSGTGIAALINGSTDLCASSRRMSDGERNDVTTRRGVAPVEVKVAVDALAVYVANSNPVEVVDVEQLAKIYRGEITRWSEVGGKDRRITMYGRETNSGTFVYFRATVLGGKDFAPQVQSLGGTSAVVDAVKSDADGIGYGGIAYANGVRVLKVRRAKDAPAIAPNAQSTEDGSYPIGRYLFLYTAGEPKGLAREFIDFVVSEPGQKVVASVGYYPLGKELPR